MFKLNIKIALRNLWKNKGFSLINIGGLAIGLASCMILLMYVAYEWSYDKQFSNNEKTYITYQSVVANGKTLRRIEGTMQPQVLENYLKE